jgi:hypothetical protein
MAAELTNGQVTAIARSIPILDDGDQGIDVLVAGGGLGGVAAALASARAGARTLLVERNAFVGGVATAGMCCSIFNCFYTRRGQLGSTGIAVEIADALAEATGYGRRWHKHKGHVIYDLEQAKWVLHRLLAESRVETLLQTVISDVVMEGRRLCGVVVENKSGPQAILARTVVDATGDADLASRSGAPLHVLSQGKHSLCFRLGNVDVDAFVDYFRAQPDQYPAYMDVEWTLDEALAQYDDCGTFLFPHGGGMQMELLRRARAQGDLPERIGLQDTIDACQMHALRRTGVVHVVTGFTSFDGLDARLISESIHDGRRMAHVVARAYRNHVPGFENAYLAGTAANLGVRTSRWIDGECTLTRAMARPGARASDRVGRLVGNDHQTRHPGENAWSVQALHDEPFDLPYRCLLPRRVEGLLMGAGRSVSAQTPWLLRVMVHTMVVGQAAGAAAALAARTGATPRDLDPEWIRVELARQDVDLG